MPRDVSIRDFPLEVIECICAHLASLYAERPLLDPHVKLLHGQQASFAAYQPNLAFEPSPSVLKNTQFHHVCLVSKQFYAAARRFLWSTVRITYPRSFQILLEKVAEPEDSSVLEARLARTEDQLLTPPASRPTSRDRDWSRRSRSQSRERHSQSIERSISMDRSLSMERSHSGDRPTFDDRSFAFSPTGSDGSFEKHMRDLSVESPRGRSSIVEEDESSMEVLERGRAERAEPERGRASLKVESPSTERSDRGRSILSRDDDGERGRSTSVVRFRERLVEEYEPPVNPGLFISSLSFSNFRTSGLRRTVGEGSQQRFVTPDRVLRFLRGTRALSHRSMVTEELSEFDPEMLRGQLRALGFTEYMDSSLDINVIEEILLRGGLLICSSHDLARPDHTYQGSALALSTTPLEALDFCGCISSRFLSSLQRFLARYSLVSEVLVQPHQKRVWFPFCQRLGLLDAALPSRVLEAFVCSFPNLTHLDLGKTRATGRLLQELGRIPTVRLKSLSLARCRAITGESLLEFFCGESQATANLEELSLNGDDATPTALTQTQLALLITTGHCFTSGKLRSLDLSSCPFTDDLLLALKSSRVEEDGQLLVLGLSCCRQITVRGVARAILTHLNTVEVLDLSKSCYARAVIPVRNGPSINIHQLHTELCNPLGKGSIRDGTRPARLRVIELDEKGLEGVQGGVYAWKTIYGKGRRGWYVDTALSARFDGEGRRVLEELPRESEAHATLLKLSKHPALNMDGNVGWNPFKMEVLAGLGRFGQEEGLYAYHSFQV